MTTFEIAAVVLGVVIVAGLMLLADKLIGDFNAPRGPKWWMRGR